MSDASTVIVKIGGEVFSETQLPPVTAGVAALARKGHRVVMVHGGGPQATAMQKRLQIEPNIVAGRRITDEPTLDVMKMIVAGRLNTNLCAALLAAGAHPVGLNGASSLAVEAVKRPPTVVSGGGPDPIDFGLVGNVVGFNEKLLRLLLDAGHLPVIACLGAAADGTVLNINADIIANQLAAGLGASHLVLVSGVPGVLRDIDDPSSRIERMTAASARAAIADGTVQGGMIPKLDETIRGLESGKVGCVHIVGMLAHGDIERAIAAPGEVGTALLP